MFHYFTIKFHFSFFASFRFFSVQIFRFASLWSFLLRSETKRSEIQVYFLAFFRFFSLFFTLFRFFSLFFAFFLLFFAFFALNFSLRFDLVILLRSETKRSEIQVYFFTIFAFFHFFSLFFAFFAFFRLIFVSLRFFRLIFAYFTFVFASDFWCFTSK